jgi:hypothetical protein
MTNPTSNFGWQMPTATDLVTDLPADFAVFGQAVDTSMADLKGGTTGQILSKATNTDMDFTWVTNDVGDITAVTAGTGISGGGTSGAVTITNDMATTITAAGDIVIGTGSGTYDNLPIGTTNQILTADTSVSPYKVKWASPTSASFVGSTCTISSSITIPTATWTQITWANELFDQGGIHAASSGEFVTNATGYWLVAGNVQWDTASGGFGQIYVNRLSGATNTQIFGSTRFDSGSYITLAFSGIVSCTSGDKLSIYAYQNSGGNRQIQGGGEPKSYISVSYLGA